MVILFHDFIAHFKDGHREKITSSLTNYGIQGGDSAMSRTVSLPAAIAVQLILQGKYNATGVVLPVTPDIYNPVLDELVTLDIKCVEKTIKF